MAKALGRAWSGGLITSLPKVGQPGAGGPGPATVRKAGATAPLATHTLPRFAERALQTLPIVGPVTPGALKLPLWALVLIAVGLVWLAALVGHISVGRG